jgi:archaeal flagellar protein FlaJ
VAFFDYLASKEKGLERDLHIAGFSESPPQYLKKNFQLALLFAVSIGVVTVIFTEPVNGLFVFPIVLLVMNFLFKGRARQAIRKREQLIDRDLLFAGQYMLVKLQSGLPLFNTLIHASHEKNETGYFFRHIVQDINTGTPIEEALSAGRDLCPSNNLKKILTEIVTSLKTGADVTDVLRSSLVEITRELMLEVQGYSKKLNSIMMFYMIIGTVIPSIGISLLLILLSFVGTQFNVTLLFIVAFGLMIMQGFFMAIINSARPTVNL